MLKNTRKKEKFKSENEKLEKRKKALVFLFRFILLSVPLYLLISLGLNFRMLQEIVASQVAFVYRAFGGVAFSEGYLVRSENVILEVVDACVAWKDVLAYCALVVSVPGIYWKKKLFGISVGLPLLYLMNLARLVTTLYFMSKFPSHAQFIHGILWKWGMILIILAFWVVWLRWAKD